MIIQYIFLVSGRNQCCFCSKVQGLSNMFTNCSACNKYYSSINPQKRNVPNMAFSSAHVYLSRMARRDTKNLIGYNIAPLFNFLWLFVSQHEITIHLHGFMENLHTAPVPRTTGITMCKNEKKNIWQISHFSKLECNSNWW